MKVIKTKSGLKPVFNNRNLVFQKNPVLTSPILNGSLQYTNSLHFIKHLYSEVKREIKLTAFSNSSTTAGLDNRPL